MSSSSAFGRCRSPISPCRLGAASRGVTPNSAQLFSNGRTPVVRVIPLLLLVASQSPPPVCSAQHEDGGKGGNIHPDRSSIKEEAGPSPSADMASSPLSLSAFPESPPPRPSRRGKADPMSRRARTQGGTWGGSLGRLQSGVDGPAFLPEMHVPQVPDSAKRGQVQTYGVRQGKAR